MGWDYFRGYEIMIIFLGLLIYGLIPWASVYFIGRLKRGCTLLSPAVSMLMLYLFKCLFLFLFSTAGIGKVFDPVCQFTASAVVLTLYWVYQARGWIAGRSSVVRWGITVLMAFISGVSMCGCCVVAWRLSALSNVCLNATARIPHKNAAAYILLILALAYYLAALLISVSASDQMKTEG